jgi:FkbM family methyltransferase
MMHKIKKLIKRLIGIKESDWALRIARDNERVRKFIERTLTSNSNCIDIGAHKGSFIDFYLTYSPNGNHIAFEPLPSYYKEISENYPGVHIYNVALNNYSGTSIFYDVKGAEAMSGFKKQHYPVDVEVNEIEVQVAQLDTYTENVDEIDFIKIDVEGAEYLVLQGSINTITKFKPTIMFEFAKLHVEEYNILPNDIYSFFTSKGYEIWRLDHAFRYSLEDFTKVFFSSHESNYDRNAETNFLAIPR